MASSGVGSVIGGFWFGVVSGFKISSYFRIGTGKKIPPLYTGADLLSQTVSGRDPHFPNGFPTFPMGF